MVRRKFIRQTASQLLVKHQIESAPVPVEAIAEGLGVVVKRAFAADELSGFLLRDHQARRSIIGVNEQQSLCRQTFTIAHELGHFLLHDYQNVHVDRGISIKLRSQKSSEGTDTEEKEANLFAAELLMPKCFVEADLEKVDNVRIADEEVISELAERYQVSILAMTFRLSYLGYIDL